MNGTKAENPQVKTPFEIGSLVEKLNLKNQSYVLNTIDALLFAQSSSSGENERKIPV